MRTSLACMVLTAAVLSGAAASLHKPVGIITAGNVFSEIIPAGKPLPAMFSDSFGNQSDNQTAVEITVGQKDDNGIEKIAVVVIDNLPRRPKGKLNVILTVTVDAAKKLRLKATVPESGYIKEFGPFPVN